MTSHRDTSDSITKKRARDRRAQQNLRDKRVAHVESLKQRIVALDRELQILHQTCHDLRTENIVLRDQQGQIRNIVASWTQEPSRVSDLDTITTTTSPVSGVAQSSSPHYSVLSTDDGKDDASPIQSGVNQTPPGNFAALATVQTPRLNPRSLDLTLPRWNMTPVHTRDSGSITDWISAICHRSPDLVLSSPEDPQPVEFLFGSKTNFLANVIHDVTRRRPCRDPERLAGGWLTYRFIKWVFEPSEVRFSRLQEFQKPVSEQLCHPHPSFVDLIMWPALRANFIKNQCAYDREEFVGMLTCCLKVRWAWNKQCLEPGDDGQFVFRSDFYNTFTKPEGWGLTRDFLDHYPALFIGLDTTSIHYEFADL